MTSSLAFNEVAQALAAGGSSVHAAEAHGCLCGALCVRSGFGFGDWLDEILPETVTLPDRDGPLADLFEQSAAVLAAPDMEFDPLLPDADAPFDERVDALSAWCQGFLYGFGSTATTEPLARSGEVTEVLADFAEISRGGSIGLDPMEIEEDAYTELVEFLRVGVQLIYDELRAERRQGSGPTTRH
jgi:uncharacterized protein YgfB (UPF0149 family)